MIALHFKRLFNKRSLLVYYALILSLFLLLTSIFNNYATQLIESDQIHLGVVSEDSHALAQVLLDSFKNSPQFTALFQLSFVDQLDAKSQFDKGELDAYVIIPEGFTEGLLTYENQGLQLYGHLENPLKNQLIAAILSGYASYIDAANASTWSLYFTMKDAKLSSPDIQKINNAFSFEMIGATLGRSNYFALNPVSELPMLSSVGYFALALPLGLITLTTLSAGTQAIVFRRQGIYKRLTIAGFSFTKQVFTEHVAQFLNGLILLIPAFIMLYFYIPNYFPPSVVLLSLSWWLWQCLWRLLSLATNDANAYVMTASSLGFIIVLSSGGFIPYLMLPYWLKQVGLWMPNLRIMQWATADPSLSQTLPQFALIVISLAIAIGVLILLEAHLAKGKKIDTQYSPL